MLHMAATNPRPKSKNQRLAQLPPEPWGWKLKRAREKYAHLTLDDAVSAVSRYMPVHGTTVSRLEQHPELPMGRQSLRHRMLAYLLCLTYGLDPEQFGLDPDDLPPGIRESVGRDLGLPSTRCYEAPPSAGATRHRAPAA